MIQTLKGQGYVVSFDVWVRSTHTLTDAEVYVFEFCGVEIQYKGYYAAMAGEWTTHNVCETTTLDGNDSTG